MSLDNITPVDFDALKARRPKHWFWGTRYSRWWMAFARIVSVETSCRLGLHEHPLLGPAMSMGPVYHTEARCMLCGRVFTKDLLERIQMLEARVDALEQTGRPWFNPPEEKTENENPASTAARSTREIKKEGEKP